MITTPALPQPQGSQPAKARFFAEAAAAFELMSLFYQLTEEEQGELREFIAGLAATVAARDLQKGNTSEAASTAHSVGHGNNRPDAPSRRRTK